MTALGNGAYRAEYTFPDPGTHEFKFRKEGDWSISIGDDFGNFAANIRIVTASANETVTFDLDLPNGRWRTSAHIFTPCTGDLDGDVDLGDLGILLANFGCTP
jgi:hypothetical protein